MIGKEMFDAVLVEGRKLVPTFDVKFKNESRLMRLIGKILFFNSEFMNGYITTIGATVYFPNRKYLEDNYDAMWLVLAHELVHAWDNKRSSFFKVGYLFPQILAGLSLLAVLAVWKVWFLWSLLFLLGLAPLPAPFRMRAELRGYTMSMAVAQWSGNSAEASYEWIVPQFTGGAYYWMWPFEKNIRNRLIRAAASIQDGTILKPEENEPFRRMLGLSARSAEAARA